MKGSERTPAPLARIVFVVTEPITARYLLGGQLSHLARSGFEIDLVSSPGRHLSEVRASEAIRCHELEMEREIRPLSDLRSFYRLFRLLRTLRPDIVSASTPKAALLGMLAAALTRTPVRVLTVRGLRLETTSGWKKLVLTLGERCASHCAHRVICVSPSLRTEYLDRGLASPKKAFVLGSGSSNGVDLTRFRPAADGEAEALRRSIDLASEALVIGFVGRLVRDKGVADLVRAFEIVLDRFPEARLLILGDREAAGGVSETAVAYLRGRDEVIAPGFIDDTAPWYRIMDLLAFPSYREGFPNAPLEAAATGVPTVGYRATGTVDAVESGVTGMLVAKGDWRALGQALCRYLKDSELRRRHGGAALERSRRHFAREIVWENWLQLYSNLAQASVDRRDVPS